MLTKMHQKKKRACRARYHHGGIRRSNAATETDGIDPLLWYIFNKWAGVYVGQRKSTISRVFVEKWGSKGAIFDIFIIDLAVDIMITDAIPTKLL